MAYALPGIPRRRLGGDWPPDDPADLAPDQPFNPFRAAVGPDTLADPWYSAAPTIPQNYWGTEYEPQRINAGEVSLPAELPPYTPPEASTPGNAGGLPPALPGPYDFPASPAEDPGVRYRQERERDYGVFPPEPPPPGFLRRMGDIAGQAIPQAEAYTGFPLGKTLEGLSQSFPEQPTIEGLRSGDLGSYLDALNVITPGVGIVKAGLGAVGPAGAAGKIAKAARGARAPRPYLGVAGRETMAFGVDPRTTYEFRYRAAPLDDLVPSHGDNFAPNKNFPSELQPRDKTRAAVQEDVGRIANQLEPSSILTDSKQLQTGSPIIGPDGLVESGNTRVMALRRARTDIPERWAAYQKEAYQAAPELGISQEEMARIKDPVIVRERITAVDRVKFAREANESTTLGMGSAEMAQIDAQRLADSVVANITIPESASLDQALMMAANRPLIQHFVASLPRNEAATILGPDGSLARAGLSRLKAALVAKAFPGEMGDQLTKSLFESIDPGIKNAEAGVLRALPSLVALRARISAGVVSSSLDISEDVARAVNTWAWIKQGGKSVEEYLSTPQMFGESLDPVQKFLLGTMYENRRSPRAIGDILAGYTVRALEAPHPSQGGFAGEFAPSAISKEGILNAVSREQKAGPLFSTTEAVAAHPDFGPSLEPAPSAAEAVPSPELAAARVGAPLPGGPPPAQQPVLPRSESPIIPLEQMAQERGAQRLREVTREQGLAELERAKIAEAREHPSRLLVNELLRGASPSYEPAMVTAMSQHISQGLDQMLVKGSTATAEDMSAFVKKTLAVAPEEEATFGARINEMTGRLRASADAAHAEPPFVPPDTGAPVGLPPGPPPGSPMPPPSKLPEYTNRWVEMIARAAERGGIEASIVRRLREAFSSQRAAPATGLARAGSAVRIMDPRWAEYPLRDLPMADALWNSTVAYKATQAHVVSQHILTMRTAIEDAFGAHAFKDVASTFMAEAYRGPDIPSLRPYVGTISDVMERAELYQLTPLQRRTADLWQKISDGSLHTAQKMGVPVGEVLGRWVGHGMVQPSDPTAASQLLDSIVAAIGSGGKRGYAKARRLSKEEYAAFAESKGAKLDTDFLAIADRRLTGMANDMSDIMWLDSVAEKMGGLRLPSPLSGAAGNKPIPFGQVAVDWRGVRWQMPKDVGGKVNEWLAQLQRPPEIKWLANANQFMRGAVYTFDLSMALGIQGWRALMSNPLGTLKDLATATRIRLTPEGLAELYAKNLDKMIYATERGLPLGTHMDLPISSPGRKAVGVEALPGIGGVVGALNQWAGGVLMPLFKLRAFEDYTGLLKSMQDGTHIHPIFGNLPVLSEAGKKLGGLYGKTQRQLEEAVAGVVANRLGGVTVKGSRSPAPLQTLFLTENWTRANIGFLGNALTLGSPEGLLARQILAREYLFQTILSVAAAAAVGKLADVEMDPRSYRWGDFDTGLGRVHLGGADQLQFLARLFFGFKEGEYGSDVPFLEQRVMNVVAQAAGQKMGPVPTTTAGLITGKDFYGQTIKTQYAIPGVGGELQGAGAYARYAAESLVLPIAAQNISEDISRELPWDQALGRALINFSGVNLKDYSARMLLDNHAVTQFNKKWADLEPWERGVIENLPAGRQIRQQQKMSDEARAMYNVKTKGYDDQAARDEARKAGTMTTDAWTNAMFQAQAARAGRRDIEQIVRGNLNYSPRNPNEVALKQYYDMVAELSKQPIFDTDLLRAQRRVLLKSWTPEERAYVQRNRHAWDTPTVREFFTIAVPQKEEYDELRRADVAKMMYGKDAAPMPEDLWRRYTTFEQKLSAEGDPSKKDEMLRGLGPQVDNFLAWRSMKNQLSQNREAASQVFRRADKNKPMTQFDLVSPVRP